MKRDNLQISKGIKYTGEALDGLPHGKGTMTYPDGQVYVGEFKDGNCHGQGTMTNPNGCSYVGEFYENKRMGHGTEIFPDGAKYVGEFKDNMPHGKGTMTYPDKGPDNEFGWATCEGEWKEGMQNGQGTLLYLDGTASYVGQWKDGMFDGSGKWTDDFDIHEGIFKEDRFWEGNEYNSDNGNLEATYKDGVYHPIEIVIDQREFFDEDAGETYVGEWKDDLFHGQGTYVRWDGSTYEGEWKEGRKHGQGTFKDEPFEYAGEWKEGLKDGQGTQIYTDTVNSDSICTYVGEFKDDQYHGQGTETWSMGREYVGQWKDGKKHGQGTNTVLTDLEPSNDDEETEPVTELVKFVGEWRDDEEWEGTLSTDDGTVLSTVSEGVRTEK